MGKPVGRKQIGGLRVLGAGQRGSAAGGCGVSFWADKNALESYSGGGYTTL